MYILVCYFLAFAFLPPVFLTWVIYIFLSTLEAFKQFLLPDKVLFLPCKFDNVHLLTILLRYASLSSYSGQRKHKILLLTSHTHCQYLFWKLFFPLHTLSGVGCWIWASKIFPPNHFLLHIPLRCSKLCLLTVDYSNYWERNKNKKKATIMYKCIYIINAGYL